MLFAVGALFIAFGIDGYVVTSAIDPSGPSNPLLKSVERVTGSWLSNFVGRGWEYHKLATSGDYLGSGWEIAVAACGFFGAIAAPQFSRYGRRRLAFFVSSLSLFGIIGTAGVALFPFLMPSSLDPKSSLTVFDASSSRMTLFIMLVAAVLFLPAIIAYTAFVFRVLRGKLMLQQTPGPKTGY